MKKKELKKLIKSARKTFRDNIQLSLIKELKEIVTQLGQGADGVEKEINKGSKQLAKKLSKKFKIDESTLIQPVVEVKDITAPETAKPAAPKTSKAKRAKAV